MRGHWGQLSSQGEASPLPAHSRAECWGGCTKQAKCCQSCTVRGDQAGSRVPTPPRGLWNQGGFLA